jgi:hypothetical protein
VYLSASAYSGLETAGSVRITPVLSDPTDDTITVGYATIAGTATPGAD